MMVMDSTKGSPFPGLNFAGELDDIMDAAMEVTMTDKWLGYINQRVLNELNGNHAGRLAFLRFLPDVSTGTVIMVPAASSDEYGATPLEYTATQNGAMINLRRAVKRMKLEPQKGRVYIFPVVTRMAPTEEVFLAFDVKNVETRPAKQFAKKDETAKASESEAPAPKAEETATGNQPSTTK